MLKKEPGSIFINYALNIRAEMKLIIYYSHLVVNKGVVKKSVKDIKGFQKNRKNGSSNSGKELTNC